MRIDVRDKKWTGLARECKLFDVDTGLEIPNVVWADVACGEYGQYKLNPDGSIYYEKGMKELIIIQKRGNIELRCR